MSFLADFLVNICILRFRNKMYLYLNTLSEILKYSYKYFKYLLLHDDLYINTLAKCYNYRLICKIYSIFNFFECEGFKALNYKSICI